MSETLRAGIVPAYLLLCLILGGSAQGLWSNLLLQLLAVAIIGWSVLTRWPSKATPAARQLFILLGLVGLLIVVQLIPLPPTLWTALPGRETVVRGFALMGEPLGAMPISLAPYATIQTVQTLLPPLAILTGMLLAGAYRPAWVAAAILAGTFLGVMVGALQVGNSNPSSPFYFYDRSNFGYALGFFANSNHMAALLVISVPFLFAAVRVMREQARSERTASAAFILGVAGAAVLIVGIALNGSLAGVLMGVPVLALSATMLVPRQNRLRRRLAGLSAALIVAAAATTVMLPQKNSDDSRDVSVQSRREMWATTLPAIVDALPVGTGIGTMPAVYHLYEDPDAVDRTVVVHAHNDYLEIALETGIAGILLILLFLLWWIRQLPRIWGAQSSDRYARAATIAAGALLVHSIVDYPLRTAALSAVFAACLAMIAQPRQRQSNQPADLWPSRHMGV